MAEVQEKRIYGYCRESTRDQAINGYNIDDQEKKIRKYVDLYYDSNFTLKILRDEGASAKNIERPKLQQIINLIKRDMVDVVVVHNLDRLTRRVKDLGIMLELFQKHNVQLISITEKIDTTSSMGRFFIYLIVLVAQWEQDTIGERTKRGLEEGANQGNYVRGGRAPFGYNYNKNTKRLEIDEIKAAIIKNLFEMFSTGDYTQQSLAHSFSSRKVNNKNNWTQGDIARILSNKIYYGCFETPKGRLIENHQPAIVSKEVWLKCERVAKGGDSLQRHKYIFRNYVYCSHCGVRCVQSTTKKTKVYKYYVCKQCGGRINEDKLMLLTKDTLSKVGANEEKEKRLQKLENSYKKHVKNMNTLTSAFASGCIDVDHYTNTMSIEEASVHDIANTMNNLRSCQTYSFSLISFSEQRSVLKKYVEKLNVDFITQSVESIELKVTDDSRLKR